MEPYLSPLFLGETSLQKEGEQKLHDKTRGPSSKLFTSGSPVPSPSRTDQ